MGKGIKQPSLENLVKLSDLFGVSVDYLIGHDMPQQKVSNLTREEEQLLDMYHQLNEAGRVMAMGQVGLILSQPGMRKDAVSELAM